MVHRYYCWYTFTVLVAPINDDCANAIALACGSTVSGSTTTATLDGPATNCVGLSVAPDVWYTVVGNGANITASLCGSAYDTKIDIYTGSCGSLTSVVCNDDFCGFQSEVTWLSVAATTYYIRVHGFVGATGSYTLNVSCACLPATITCPANITVNNAANQCGNTVSYTPTVTGLPAPAVTYSFSGATTGGGSGDGSGSFFNVGTTTITLTATNTCGTASCSFTVTVNDTEPPSITCPSNITVNNTPGTCGAVVTFAPPSASDNCPGVTVVSVPASGSTFPVGVTTVTSTATDAAGNTATCQDR